MRTATAILLGLALACGGGEATDDTDLATDVSTDTGGEETASAFDWGNAMGDDLRVNGQPSSSDLEAASAAGFTTVISLRTEGEPGSEGEQETAEGLGMTFVSIPVPGAEGLTEANAQALDEALDAATGPVVLHCGSGNRAGSLLGLRAYVTEGASGDEALSMATEAGMSSLEPALRAKLTELCAAEPDRCPTAP